MRPDMTLLVLPLGAAALYLSLGAPLIPGQPHAERRQVQPGQSSVAELVARVESRLEENPNDGSGWEVIGPVYMRLGRFDDAVKAAQKMNDLKPSLPAYSRASHLRWLRGDVEGAKAAAKRPTTDAVSRSGSTVMKMGTIFFALAGALLSSSFRPAAIACISVGQTSGQKLKPK